MQGGLDCICIDPGESAPIVEYIEQNNLNLCAILITHHHYDHTQGIPDLLNRYAPDLYVPSTNIHEQGKLVKNGDEIYIKQLAANIKVISTPGHTLDHVTYNIGDSLFTGDTLFKGGCGRIFEGSYAMLYESLQKIASYPSHYKIFCGHEYTVNNLRFASICEPNNQHIKDTLDKIYKNGKDYVTLPSTIALELQINPFLRCHSPDIIASMGNSESDPVEVFTYLRNSKDIF